MTKIKTRKIGLLLDASLLLAATGVATALTTTSCGKNEPGKPVYDYVGDDTGKDWKGHEGKGGTIVINFPADEDDHTCSIGLGSSYEAENLVIPKYIKHEDKEYEVVQIEAGAFAGTMVDANTNLSGTITIPDSITSIGAEAFVYCIYLTNIAFNSAINIKSAAFAGCTALTNIAFNSATIIGPAAFSQCTSLVSIDFNSVTQILPNAFKGCANLTNIIIPNSVISLGTYVFEGCVKLNSIQLKNFSNTEGFSYDKYVFQNIGSQGGIVSSVDGIDSATALAFLQQFALPKDGSWHI